MPQKELIFDAPTSKRLAEEGKQAAAEASSASLDQARRIARTIAVRRDDRCVTADDIGEELERLGAPQLGPEAGSVFAQKSVWEFTGRRVKSSRVSNRHRELKVWRYLDG